MPRFSIVIPVRNERASIPPLFEKFESALDEYQGEFRIVVIDGFSSDGTVDAVSRYANGLPIQIIELSENLGLGGALNAGLLAALQDSEIIVTMDGDDSHDPAHIPAMLRALESGQDLVVASRFEDGGEEVGVAGHRRFMSHAASRILRTVFPMRDVKDYSSGFRAYRSTALRNVQQHFGELVEERGFSCQLELLLKLRAISASAAEVPLVLRYDLKRTESKMNVPHTMARYAILMGRYYGKAPLPRRPLVRE
jgi:dolichol-phosphate mannosyltransferase